MAADLNRHWKRFAYTLAVSVAVMAGTSPAVAGFGSKTYGAIGGTTANKTFSNWSEFNVGGVKNTASGARDWLMSISLDKIGCYSSPCTVRATFRGGSNGTSCVRAYRVNEFGAFTSQIGPVCQGTTLATKTIGSVSTPSSGAGYAKGQLLVVATLNSGATPGAMTSVEVDDGFAQWGVVGSRGAIHGSTATFDKSNWTEHWAGGVRNQATIARNWLISVPNPAVPFSAPYQPAGATFGGGFGGQSCVIAYGVTASGTVAAASSQVCRTSLGFADFGELAGAHVLYVASLARASSAGANDGGFITTIRY